MFVIRSLLFVFFVFGVRLLLAVVYSLLCVGRCWRGVCCLLFVFDRGLLFVA